MIIFHSYVKLPEGNSASCLKTQSDSHVHNLHICVSRTLTPWLHIRLHASFGRGDGGEHYLVVELAKEPPTIRD